ncbi:hypothetical protein NDN08_001050 [Rhodosorus marinus]|uniref:Transmembrane protein n=1 Tax=Rhodosorus marinus TaxID=101924 RepID=A0AAV8UTC3_9RHOD|nr:hypothetical protein NDN08_001050 [Rhodosorus marinus]
MVLTKKQMESGMNDAAEDERSGTDSRATIDASFGWKTNGAAVETTGLIPRDVAWIWACYALSAWVVACSSLSLWPLDPGELRRFHLSEGISELAAWGWFCSLIVTRLTYWINPCHGKGLQSSLEAVFTLSFTSFSFAYMAVAPEMVIPATSTALLFLTSSWTFMITSFKVKRMPPSFITSPPGRLIRLVRRTPIAGGVLFGSSELCILMKYLHALPQSSMNLGDFSSTLLGCVLSVRIAYAIVELLAGLYALSTLAGRDNQARKTS